jgi:hypothetical protein
MCKLADFLVWEIFSDGNWKAKKRQPNQASYSLEQEIGEARQLRDFEYKSRRKIEELENQLREKEKERKSR